MRAYSMDLKTEATQWQRLCGLSERWRCVLTISTGVKLSMRT
jgi:hypothetical protein